MLDKTASDIHVKIQSGADECSEKPSTKNSQIIFRTTEESKKNLKTFFASHGLTLSRGIQLACLYFEKQVRAGGIKLTPAGMLSEKDI